MIIAEKSSSIPKLRFPEFTTDWSPRKLEDIATFSKGSSLSKSDLTEDGHPCVLYGELYTKYKEVITEIHSRTKSKDTKLVMGYKGDVLIPSSGETAIDIACASALEVDEVYLGGDLNIIRPIKDVNSVFLSYELNSARKKELVRIAQGATVVHLYHSGLKAITVFLPEIKEQEKIASFFTLIDRKVVKQKEKIEQLKLLKKGMMQKIFSQKLRFQEEDGKVYPQWKLKPLKSIGTTYTGLSGKTSEDFGVGEAKYITYMNVFANVKAKSTGVEKVDLSDGKKQNQVLKGDLLFTTSSEIPEEVGMVSYWESEEQNVYLNSFCFGYRLNTKEVIPEFLAYMLRSEGYRRHITILAQGSTRYNLSKTELLKMNVEIPSLNEQKKIISLLSSIDNKIEKEEEKLTILTEQKKSYMQQMFI
ncbi:restriction endonuclease subunit S [Bacillus sp. V5-8f]|uniref:restriction endonuclease subunit S n=1 Tax=Bacillus sp. V5-8f TaxID=2053044 RepID=UPI000C776255|nr:restriction endonuclease subunit S [Bacillus sp. V5-8f]PLT33642.1 restriction endonuclease subunit S [Bacillus sp. V5-8f]